VVTPAARKVAVTAARDAHGISERRACSIIGADRSAMRYRHRRADETATRTRLKELATERRRFGWRRLKLLLEREGISMNHKKLRRLYTEERLQVRRRGGRKRALGTRAPTLPQGPNQRWSLDFVSDTLTDGRRFRILVVVAWQRDYNEVRPHSAHGGQVPASIRPPSCSPASRPQPGTHRASAMGPVRAGFAGGLRPALTQAARDGGQEIGRDRETALDRTERLRHDGRDGNPGLYF
jgi:hypothetical protein